MLASVLCAGAAADGVVRDVSGLPLRSVADPSAVLASVPCAGTTAEGSGAKDSELKGASTVGVGTVGADAADVGAGNGTPPPLSSAHVYTVLMEAGVIVAVVVHPAAEKVVVYVSTRVMGSALGFGAAFGVHAVPGSLEGKAGSSEVVRTVGAFGTRGSEIGTVLWLDGNAAPPFTGRTVGVGLLSALVALGTMSEPVARAVAGALVV